MTSATAAAPVTRDQLLDSKQLVALACAAHGLAPVHNEIALGEFTLEGETLYHIRQNRLFGWRIAEDEERIFGYDDPHKQIFSGENELRSGGRWEMAWPVRAQALTLKVGGIIRANDGTKQVEMVMFVEGGGNDRGRGRGRAYGNPSSYFTSFIRRRFPEPFHPLFLKGEGWGVTLVAEYHTLGHGRLKTVAELFEEFAGDKPLRRALSEAEKLSPFRPEKAWGYHVPAALWAPLIEGWEQQLREFKAGL